MRMNNVRIVSSSSKGDVFNFQGHFLELNYWERIAEIGKGSA